MANNDIDLTKGDPPAPKDPPLHRLSQKFEDLFDYLEENAKIGGITHFGLFMLIAGWLITAGLFIPPFTGVVDGWSSSNANAIAMVILGGFAALITLIGTIYAAWLIEEDVIERRHYDESDSSSKTWFDFVQQMQAQQYGSMIKHNCPDCFGSGCYGGYYHSNADCPKCNGTGTL